MNVTVAQPAGWVEHSNRNAGILLEVMARYSPEQAGNVGVAGHDEAIVDLTPGFRERALKDYAEAAARLERLVDEERDAAVRQDLEILVKAARDEVKGIELSTRLELPYYNVPELVFSGIHGILDEQVAPERHPAALVRLRKYAGMEPGTKPLAELAEEDIRAALKSTALPGPYRVEVEKHLERTRFFLDGIRQLFATYRVDGSQEPLKRLEKQVAKYQAFIRKELIPRSRDDFRLPPELYAFNLEQFGIDLPPDRLARKARQAFRDIQVELERLAPRMAAQLGLQTTDYRVVLRELRERQLKPTTILSAYNDRAEKIEAIIRREDIVSLPERPMRIRLALPAEAAAVAAPHMRPPRLIGNTGEMGEFVLPVAVPAAEGGTRKMTQAADFTYDAISWMLTAHEGRPGHELQFAAMVDRGVSTARAVFAFNSVNAEGWALYAETLIYPFVPLEGQMSALQFQLLRAARAFLDPEMQMGMMTVEEARQILEEEVCITPAFSEEEIDRYTFFLPGQAPSYFYGFIQLKELREETEKLLGPLFNQRQFHDFILGQGLVPPRLLKQAVLGEFVVKVKAEEKLLTRE